MNKNFFILIMLMIPLSSDPTFALGVVKKQYPLIGSKAKAWQVADWFSSSKLELRDLNNKVVLIRWWTAPHCPFCLNSAPALNEFYEQYYDKGLEVIGFYHHKSLKPVDKDKIKQYAKNLGFKFPIAIDYEWRTLKEWWLNHEKRGWTSITFLIDRKGIIRNIHPGGQYIKGDQDYKEIKEMIEMLLAENL